MATRNPAVMPTSIMTLLLLKDGKDNLPPVTRIGDSDLKSVVPPPVPITAESKESGKCFIMFDCLLSTFY